MSAQRTSGPWVTYNEKTATYDTPDGTKVATELVDGVVCLADVLRIAQVRAQQRAVISLATGAAS